MIGSYMRFDTVFLAHCRSLNSRPTHFDFPRSLFELSRPHGQCFSGEKGCGVLGAWSDVDLDNGCNDIFSSILLSFVDGSRKRHLSTQTTVTRDCILLNAGPYIHTHSDGVRETDVQRSYTSAIDNEILMAHEVHTHRSYYIPIYLLIMTLAIFGHCHYLCLRNRV